MTCAEGWTFPSGLLSTSIASKVTFAYHFPPRLSSASSVFAMSSQSIELVSCGIVGYRQLRCPVVGSSAMVSVTMKIKNAVSSPGSCLGGGRTDRLQAMKVFTCVVEAKSFSRATLGLSRTSVTVAIQCLEAHLKVRLLQRTTRRLNLTANGAAYYERCVRVLAEIDDIENSLRVLEGSLAECFACTCPVRSAGQS